MSCGGHRAEFVYVDELSDHSADALAHALAAVDGSALPPPLPVVKPIDVHCRYCGAEPGTPCQRWRRTKRGKVRQNRDSPHGDRRHDARLATEAVRALNPA